ncbi:hypothetical protein SALWKB2_1644 [Snodgrassella alvi wkB2]|nr:hypothetical protein SALWKB2_1644 [Snodgrassella alvi wkB2]PIT45566.1 hypothetical protein BHC45_04215 [Snodgrassella alvi]
MMQILEKITTLYREIDAEYSISPYIKDKFISINNFIRRLYSAINQTCSSGFIPNLFCSVNYSSE